MSVEKIVKDYYGKVLQSKHDLKTSACCTAESFPSHIKPIASKIHSEVLERFYGCGVPFTPAIDGKTVLDLGCGTGRDCFIYAPLVGDQGRVIGVDMTEEQISCAKQYVDYHVDQFQMKKNNLEFHHGYNEDLKSCGIEDESIDVVVSNCVLNLSPDKEKVFKEIFRVLKPGGELYFSDVFSDRRLSKEVAKDPVLVGECLGGALYIQDFRRILNQLGINDYRVVTQSNIDIHDPESLEKIGNTRFYSMTIRAFKLDLEDRCEDYGQVATYLGTIPHTAPGFQLDDHHYFEAHRPMLVCSNTAAMLTNTRFNTHFKVEGNTQTHFGLFQCEETSNTPNQGGCC